jgi:hypothetical protein
MQTDSLIAPNAAAIVANMPWVANTSQRMIGCAAADGIVGDPSETAIALLTSLAAANTAFSAVRTLVGTDEEARAIVGILLDLLDTTGDAS